MAKPLKPGRIILGGEAHVATVFQVIGWDDDGSPREFRLLRDDERVTLNGDEQFYVVYALESITGKAKN